VAFEAEAERLQSRIRLVPYVRVTQGIKAHQDVLTGTALRLLTGTSQAPCRMVQRKGQKESVKNAKNAEESRKKNLW